MSKIGGLMFGSSAVPEEMENRPFPGKQPTYPLPRQGRKLGAEDLKGSQVVGTVFLTDLEDVSKQ